MKHQSVKLNTPCEFINITPLNPLISKCEIKVCYVSDEPNRNGSIITKNVATQMANSLPGSPIVGFYNDNSEDFEEHNRSLEISNGTINIKDMTRPYGFVDLNAKVWFQKFLDDNETEREYLMTEGYIWSGVYPESQRVLEQGNNQSMELKEEYLNGSWTKDDKTNKEFFIINEAIISKLCILGEDCEPCFEGAQIATEFSFNEDFKSQLFSMMNEIKDLLVQKGGDKVVNQFAVEIGGALWDSIWSYLITNYPDPEDSYCSAYSIEGIYEEDNSTKYVIVKDRLNSKFYRINFSYNDETGLSVEENSFVEVSKTYVPKEKPQFDPEEVNAYSQKYIQEKMGKDEKQIENKTEDILEENPKDTLEVDPEVEVEKVDTPKSYILDEIPEYVDLLENHNSLKNEYSQLEESSNNLKEEYNSLKADYDALLEFKQGVERKEKQAMIDSFYMLNEEDKADVLENIDNYSLDEIEAKLSVICVRNKVSFATENNSIESGSTVYNLNNGLERDSEIPDWARVAFEISENKNKN